MNPKRILNNLLNLLHLCIETELQYHITITKRNKYGNTDNKNYFYELYRRLGAVDPKLKTYMYILCTLLHFRYVDKYSGYYFYIDT